MKKLFVILAVIAVAALTVTSCKKDEDPAISKVKKECVGTWAGTLSGNTVNVVITSAFKITCGNFEASITNWYMKNGSVCVDLNNGKSMMISTNGNQMTITSNDAAISSSLPSSLTRVVL